MVGLVDDGLENPSCNAGKVPHFSKLKVKRKFNKDGTPWSREQIQLEKQKAELQKAELLAAEQKKKELSEAKASVLVVDASRNVTNIRYYVTLVRRPKRRRNLLNSPVGKTRSHN